MRRAGQSSTAGAGRTGTDATPRPTGGGHKKSWIGWGALVATIVLLAPGFESLLGGSASSADAGADAVVDVGIAGRFDGSPPRAALPLNHTWFFGDGAQGHGAVTTHPYGTLGVYQVTLVVRDANGWYDLDTVDVTVRNDVPVARAGAGRTGGGGGSGRGGRGPHGGGGRDRRVRRVVVLGYGGRCPSAHVRVGVRGRFDRERGPRGPCVRARRLLPRRPDRGRRPGHVPPRLRPRGRGECASGRGRAGARHRLGGRSPHLRRHELQGHALGRRPPPLRGGVRGREPGRGWGRDPCVCPPRDVRRHPHRDRR